MGIATSAICRYGISAAAGIASPVARFYNLLDMVISAAVSHIFKDQGAKKENALLAGKLVGFLTATLITTRFVGAIALPHALALSVLAGVASALMQVNTPGYTEVTPL